MDRLSDRLSLGLAAAVSRQWARMPENLRRMYFALGLAVLDYRTQRTCYPASYEPILRPEASHVTGGTGGAYVVFGTGLRRTRRSLPVLRSGRAALLGNSFADRSLHCMTLSGVESKGIWGFPAPHGPGRDCPTPPEGTPPSSCYQQYATAPVLPRMVNPP